MTRDDHEAPPEAVAEVQAWFAMGRNFEREVVADAPSAWFIAERRSDGALLLGNRFRPYMVLVEGADAGADALRVSAVPGEEARRARAALVARAAAEPAPAPPRGDDAVRGFYQAAIAFVDPRNRGASPPPRDPDGYERLGVVERDGRVVLELREVATGARLAVSYRVIGGMKVDLRVEHS